MTERIDAAFARQWDANAAEWLEWRALHDASTVEEVEFWHDVLTYFTFTFA